MRPGKYEPTSSNSDTTDVLANEYLELDEDTDIEFENVYLDICDEEGRQFTAVTTFHGMIRIFLSQTWTSLIFWSFVVMTCLVFYMIFCGYILSCYARATTFMRISSHTYQSQQTTFTVCSTSNLSHYHFSTRSQTVPSSHENCINFRSLIDGRPFELKVSNTTKYSGLTLTFLNHEPVHLRNGYSHQLLVKPSQMHRLNSARAPCVPQVGRSMAQVVDSDENEGGSKKIFPPCTETIHKIRYSTMKTEKGTIKLSIEFSNTVEKFWETKKMGITDVLSYLGGATSLFLGCSCVTLMETFVFLFKLILQSFTKEADTELEDEENCADQISPLLLDTEGTKDEQQSNGDGSSTPHRQNQGESGTRDPDNQSNCVQEIEKPAKQGRGLGRRAFTDSFPRNILHRQPAFDVTDGTAEQSEMHSNVFDDVACSRPLRGPVRRVSTNTSVSSSSRTRVVRLNVNPSQMERRRSHIFTRHMTMNDF